MPRTKDSQRGLVYLGLDVAKDSIAVGILRPDEVEPDTEKIFHDEASIRRLIGRFDDVRHLRACYEAGATSCTACSSRSGSQPMWSPPRSSPASLAIT